MENPAPPLDNPDELLLRQVHPNFVVDGRITSQAFRPTPKDEKLLSVARNTLTNPAAAYDLHTSGKQLPSSGTWAVSVGETQAEGLPARPDPILVPVPDPAHAVVDFTVCPSKGQIEIKATKLTNKARDRKRLYP